MTATVAVWGNSLAIRIPKNEIRRLWLVSGSKIRLTPSGGGILIEPIQEKGPEFAHLLTRKQILTLTKNQYAAYIKHLSQEEREEIWRREDQDENIPAEVLFAIDQEAESYLEKS